MISEALCHCFFLFFSIRVIKKGGTFVKIKIKIKITKFEIIKLRTSHFISLEIIK